MKHHSGLKMPKHQLSLHSSTSIAIKIVQMDKEAVLLPLFGPGPAGTQQADIFIVIYIAPSLNTNFRH